jgi:hypothetical protein
MRPLQDQCDPTSIEGVSGLFLSDVGRSIDELFSSFDPVPIGVASLAQVHTATDRASGRKVAVKIMHPDLEDFAQVDMKTTTMMLRLVKAVFPSFEFTWLGEEMEQNLPLEMDFREITGLLLFTVLAWLAHVKYFFPLDKDTRRPTLCGPDGTLKTSRQPRSSFPMSVCQSISRFLGGSLMMFFW